MFRSNRIKGCHRRWRYKRCQRCGKVCDYNLIQNDWIDETDGLVYYCKECAEQWNEIYKKLNSWKAWEVKDALRRFMHKGFFRYR